MDSKYLVFSLADKFFGVPISKVTEIIRFDTITPVYDVASCVQGVINLRGKIVTIFDARERFGMIKQTYGKYTVFIICEVLSRNGTNYSIGMAVDVAHQVEIISDSAIRSAEGLGLQNSSQYLTGIVHGRQGLMQLIDMDKLVQDIHAISLQKMPVPMESQGIES